MIDENEEQTAPEGAPQPAEDNVPQETAGEALSEALETGEPIGGSMSGVFGEDADESETGDDPAAAEATSDDAAAFEPAIDREIESVDLSDERTSDQYPGTLTIVGVPFANAGDVTLRGSRALQA